MLLRSLGQLASSSIQRASREHLLRTSAAAFSSSTREQLQYDVVIVGSGALQLEKHYSLEFITQEPTSLLVHVDLLQDRLDSQLPLDSSRYSNHACWTTPLEASLLAVAPALEVQDEDPGMHQLRHAYT
eukprot:1158687-Pelagomonas_calceolata.AAC.18